jgi:hypothetical protein
MVEVGLDRLGVASRQRVGALPYPTVYEAVAAPALSRFSDNPAGKTLRAKSIVEMLDRIGDEEMCAPVVPGANGPTPRGRSTARWEGSTPREGGVIRDDTPRSIREIIGQGQRMKTNKRIAASAHPLTR